VSCLGIVPRNEIPLIAQALQLVLQDHVFVGGDFAAGAREIKQLAGSCS